MIFLSCHFWFLRLRGVLATIDWGTALYGERSKKLRRTTRILQQGQSEWRCMAHMGFERDRRDANLGVGVVIICVQAVSSRGYQRLEFFQDEHYLVSVELGILRGFHRFSPTLLFSLFVLLWFCLRFSLNQRTPRACNSS